MHLSQLTIIEKREKIQILGINIWRNNKPLTCLL